MNPLLSVKGRYAIACSGGPDSMAALHYLMGRSYTTITGVLTYIHNDDSPIGTNEFCCKGSQLVENYCVEHGVPVFIRRSHSVFIRNREAQWRYERYTWFSSMSNVVGNKIILAHNLDDAIEGLIMSLVRNAPFSNPMPAIVNNGLGVSFYRPFITTDKCRMREYCIDNGVPFLDDPLNNDDSLMRPCIRHKIVPILDELPISIRGRLGHYYRDDIDS